jgi:hypothetical protein
MSHATKLTTFLSSNKVMRNDDVVRGETTYKGQGWGKEGQGMMEMIQHILLLTINNR